MLLWILGGLALALVAADGDDPKREHRNVIDRRKSGQSHDKAGVRGSAAKPNVVVQPPELEKPVRRVGRKSGRPRKRATSDESAGVGGKRDSVESDSDSGRGNDDITDDIGGRTDSEDRQVTTLRGRRDDSGPSTDGSDDSGNSGSETESGR